MCVISYVVVIVGIISIVLIKDSLRLFSGIGLLFGMVSSNLLIDSVIFIGYCRCLFRVRLFILSKYFCIEFVISSMFVNV